MKGDPRLRDHKGTCAWCHKPREPRANLDGIYRMEAKRDPFCSSDCCSKWWQKHRGVNPWSSST